MENVKNVSESEMTNSLTQVHINLVIHTEEDDVHISFNFDTQKDNVDQIVKELITEIGLTPDEGIELKRAIENQLKVALGTGSLSSDFDSIAKSRQNSFIDESDDADVQNDREYQALLEQQRRQLSELEIRQTNEQKELIAKLQRGSPINTPQTCDDLIIFG